MNCGSGTIKLCLAALIPIYVKVRTGNVYNHSQSIAMHQCNFWTFLFRCCSKVKYRTDIMLLVATLATCNNR